MRVVVAAIVSIACPFTLVGLAGGAEERIVTLSADFSGKGTQVVAHPAAEGKHALAIDVSSISGGRRVKMTSPRLAAGRYRVTVFARLHQRPSDDLSRLVVQLSVGAGKGNAARQRLAWTQFDSSPDRFTPLQTDLTALTAFTPTLEMSWQQIVNASNERVRPIRPLEPPASPTEAKSEKPRPLADDDLLTEIENRNQAVPLTAIDYPALLIDRVTFEPVSRTQWVESVRPRFVHVFPGGANPIEANFRNIENRPVRAVAKLEVRGGLEEVLASMEQPVLLPPSGSATCQFDWTAGKREFGHEARVALLVDGQAVHAASDYFSVSAPIWKTALQASGFLTWHGREQHFAEHVRQNRANYLNVEEAFSWQPSSWTDLTPEGVDWWSGQNDFHNSLAGLRQWIDLSHAEGIKMITYLWPSASGPSGLEWARQNPELVTHQPIGLSTEFLDVEDLRLRAVTQTNPQLWHLRSGIWNSVGINRGMLRAIDEGIRETVASGKEFGWDGARFDMPPGWSAMGAQETHAEFQKLGVAPLMKKLAPEYFQQTSGTWSSEAISVCNVRYARQRLREPDRNFALSYNFGIAVDAPPGEMKFFDECCADGGQIMDEAIRGAAGGLWRDYLARIHTQSNLIRQRGGHHCVVALDATNAVSRCYAAICTFAGGSHPYLDYGWSQPLPGNYTQFMTRYGEYCWAADLEPVAPDEAGFTIEDQDLLWGNVVRRRGLPEGGTQWVLHLISPPPTEQITPKKPGQMQPWRRDVTVGRKSNREPTVWAISAEPTTRGEPLEPEQVGDAYRVSVPEHRLWTVLVWTE